MWVPGMKPGTGLLCQIVLTVQFVDILRDDDALGVLPRTLADPVARIDGGFAVGRLGAEIGVPSAAARAGRLGQLLAMPVGTFEAAEIGALANGGARHEEAHAGLLRVGCTGNAERQHDRDGAERPWCRRHSLPLIA